MVKKEQTDSNNLTKEQVDLNRQRREHAEKYAESIDLSRHLLSQETKEIVKQLEMRKDEYNLRQKEEAHTRLGIENNRIEVGILKDQRAEIEAKIKAWNGWSMLSADAAMALEEQSNALEEQIGAIEDANKALEKQLTAQQKLTAEAKKAMLSKAFDLAKKGIYESVGGSERLTSVLKDIASGSLVSIAALIKLAFERFVELDKAAESFRRTTGLTISQTRELRENAERINAAYQDMGVGIEEAYKATEALVSAFGGMALAGERSVETAALLSANLGVAAENTAEVLNTFQGLGGLSEEAANNMVKAGAAMTKGTPVSFSKVMEDIAKASDDVHTLLGDNPKTLMKTAIAARSLGVSMNSLASMSKKLLDFQSSINNEMEASALLGKSVNFQRARQLAFDGKLADAAKETLRVVKQAGDWNKMSVFQRESLAKASGMELKDLNKMVALDRIRASGSKEGEKLKALDAQLKTMDAMNDLTDEKLVKDAEDEIKQRQIQSVMTDLGNMMKSIFLELSNILQPIVKVLVSAIVPALKLVGVLMKTIGVLLSPIGNLFEFIDKNVGSMTGLLDKASGYLEDFKKWLAGDYVIVKGIVSATVGLLAIWSAIVAMKKSSFLLDKMMSKVPGVEMLKGGVGKTGGLLGKATDKLGGGLSKLTGGLSKLTGGIGKAVGGLFEGLAEGLKKLGSPKVFLGILAVAAIGASIIPLAIALKMFTGIDWAEVTKAGIALVALAITAGVMGTFAANILLGAVAIAGLGLAIMPLAIALKMFTDIDWGAVAKAGLALVALAVVAGIMGIPPIFAAIMLGALAIAALGVALIPFAAAAWIAGKASQELGKGIDIAVKPLLAITDVGPERLVQTAAAIGAVSLALASFGAGAAVSGIGSLVGKLTGGDPVKKLKQLASLGNDLTKTAGAIQTITNAFSGFGIVDKFSTSISSLADSMDKLNKSISNISLLSMAKLTAAAALSPKSATVVTPTEKTVEKTSSTEPTPTKSDGDVVGKVQELIDLLRNGAIAVNLDGRRVSSALTNVGR